MNDEIKVPLIVGCLTTMGLQVFGALTRSPLDYQGMTSFAINVVIGIVAAGIAFAVMKFVVK